MSFDGSLAKIDRVPAELRAIYATAFEVDPSWLVECASRRQKWIDQAQSLNIYMAGASGKKLHDTYMLAWLRGLKTTYYLRTLGATSAEKSTTDKIGQLNAVSADGGMNAGFSYAAGAANAMAGGMSSMQSSMQPAMTDEPIAPKFCALDDPECEACQ
jgi:ribonucleoside-diphosphate reductase alpha chain